jgi:hypothetical protein
MRHAERGICRVKDEGIGSQISETLMVLCLGVERSWRLLSNGQPNAVHAMDYPCCAVATKLRFINGLNREVVPLKGYVPLTGTSTLSDLSKTRVKRRQTQPSTGASCATVSATPFEAWRRIRRRER